MKYIKEFLEIAPFSHAVWRSAEAGVLSKAFTDFKPQPPFLDVGCGFGEFMGVFCREIRGGMVDVGIDISQRAINMVTKKDIYKKLICCDARDLSGLLNQFNSITAISVLEHINDVGRVFTEISKALKPGGYFIFTVPTAKLSSPLWRLLLHPVFSHKNLYSPQDWLNLAEISGFEIKQMIGTLSPKQLVAFEYGLPLALPTQLSLAILKKRLPFSLAPRVSFLEKLIKRNLVGDVISEVNILVVAQKPL